MTDETVKLSISIQINVDDLFDTGETIATWNALTGKERWDIAHAMWMEAASRDDGGMNVATEGAEDI